MADAVGARVEARGLGRWGWRGLWSCRDWRPFQLAGDVVLVFLPVGGLLRVQLCFRLGMPGVWREENVLVCGGSCACLVLLVATQDPEQQGDGN